ncbi:MAG: ATP phosphoribosyltransferase regulatory subunit [Eubacteriales bacterium]|nr:ATP phosphoribosyltransferase regulatory subunit [Eubacteriales bacterium]
MIDRIKNQLNQIYESCGYRRFRMSKFESYDLYAQNRDFLKSERIITFTDLNGSLLALKPDITLSIIKNNDGTEEKVYYNENVYRAQENTYKEIMQVGVECIGQMDAFTAAEVVSMAARSLASISDRYVLELSDAGFVSLLLETMEPDETTRAVLLSCLAKKNVAGIEALSREGRLTEAHAGVLKKLMGLYLPLREGIEAAAALSPNEASDSVLAGLSRIADILEAAELSKQIYLDFSLVNSMDYYNGIIFQGFVEGIPFSVLSGGRYDRLPEKMGKKQGAIGFAVYMDRLEAYLPHERKFDADLLLVYDKSDDYREVAAYAEGTRAVGRSVRCVRKDELSRMPKAPRCQVTILFSELSERAAGKKEKKAGAEDADGNGKEAADA